MIIVFFFKEIFNFTSQAWGREAESMITLWFYEHKHNFVPAVPLKCHVTASGIIRLDNHYG